MCIGLACYIDFIKLLLVFVPAGDLTIISIAIRLYPVLGLTAKKQLGARTSGGYGTPCRLLVGIGFPIPHHRSLQRQGASRNHEHCEEMM